MFHHCGVVVRGDHLGNQAEEELQVGSPVLQHAFLLLVCLLHVLHNTRLILHLVDLVLRHQVDDPVGVVLRRLPLLVPARDVRPEFLVQHQVHLEFCLEGLILLFCNNTLW